MNYKIVLIILAIILFAVFIIQNTTMVTVTFFVFDATMPRAILLFITLALGVLIGIFLPYEFRKGNTKNVS